MSPIGFGAFKIGRNTGIKYPRGYALPGEDDAARLLNGVLDLGISYIDTAPAYGDSEARIGRAIAHRRGEYVLSSKVGETFEGGGSAYDFSGAAARASVERSLRRLRTDVLDIVFVHSDGNDLAILEQTDLVEALEAIRDAGLARAIGFSGKTVAGARAALSWADVLMVEYHPAETAHEAVIAEAAAEGTGIVVKKGLASGHLPPEQAIPFVLGNPAVASMVVGSLSLEHLAADIRLAGGAGGS